MPVDFNPAAVGFDPADPAFIADPYPVYTKMREIGPVLYYPSRDVHLLTGFAEVNAALRDRRLGRAYRQRYTDEEFGQPGDDPRWPHFYASERWSLLNIEPPDHTRLRRLVTKVFTARSIAALRPQIQTLADQHLTAALADGGRFELISDYAQPFSVAVICTLLGVPLPDGPRLLAWSHRIVKMYEFSTSDDERAEADRAAAEFMEYILALIEARREHPEDDLITELVQVADLGDRLTVDEIVSTVIVLLNAGHEATVNTLGNGMRALLTHPDQWARVLDGAVAPATVVEEMLRWDAPLQLFERWVLEEGVVIGDREFRVGERIAMMFGSANRDPRRFPDADRFDAGRGESTHIGFGGGLHFCIGAPLARLELETSVALLRQHPGLVLAAEPEYHPAFVIRGLTGLSLAT
ncbi:unspecific monooxygenase [Nakamurella panacisegetis]|uniref:Unspecific monooxygenase n=1 Tax=Nakamurella panacisegetis TaxID=1090615 RepID=A0A1H0KEY9_9ACTN|nr:cytochrome P450 [Nakamurella panacisegetis]SDO54380.1 unspecific monooxygenase [Nakamurella panacisegetis]